MQHYASVEGLDEAAHALVVDNTDQVIYTGRANVAGQGSQMLTMKLAAADGQILWSDYRGGTANLDDTAWDVVVGSDGHPVVSGLVVNSGGTALGVIRKLHSTDGHLIWEYELAGAINDISTPSSWLGQQANDDVVLCERVFGANGYDVVLARFGAATGDTVWTTLYDGATHGGDDPRAMIQGDDGDLVVVGVQDTSWNYNYMVLKFDQIDGALLWEAPGYDGPPGWYDVASCATLGPDGEIVVSGLSDGVGSGWDIATVGYDPATGSLNWAHRYDGAASQTDEGRDVQVAADGTIFVTGYSYGTTTGKDLLAYRLNPSIVSDVANLLPSRTQLGKAWPNPFNPRVNLRLSLAESGWTRVAVYDQRGHLVVTLADGYLPAGDHAVVWQGRDARDQSVAAGVYFVRLQTGEAVASQKVVLVE